MKYIDEFRNVNSINSFIEKIQNISTRKFNVMEICGGHTVAIHKFGFNKLLNDNINFLSGPGCPVCVTAINDIDKIIHLSKQADSIICIYGDLFKVPGSVSSLMYEKANGADIRIVYSVHDAINISIQEENKIVYFAGIGFETTAPLTGAAILEAQQKNVKNFRVLCLHKIVPPAVDVLLSDTENLIDAFILPGHVSAVIGEAEYNFISDKFNKPAVITAFEPLDLISSIYILIDMLENGKAEIVNNYKRVVKKNGNSKALNVLNSVFGACDSNWRGIGVIPNSGLKLKKIYSQFDAENFIDFPEIKSADEKGCICGEILTGKKKPYQCALFGKVCSPDNPFGACMVSNEGACGAYYKYNIKFENATL